MRETLATFFGTGLWGIIKAALLLILAFIVAKIVKKLIVKLMTKTKLHDLLGKSETSEESKGKIIEKARGKSSNLSANWPISLCSCCSCRVSLKASA